MFSNIITTIKSNVAVTAIVATGLTGVAGVTTYTLTRPIKATTDNTVEVADLNKATQEIVDNQKVVDKEQNEKINEVVKATEEIKVAVVENKTEVKTIIKEVEKIKEVPQTPVVAPTPTPITTPTQPVVTPTPTPAPVEPVAPVDELRVAEIKKLLEEKNFVLSKTPNIDIYIRVVDGKANATQPRIEFSKWYNPANWLQCVVPGGIGSCFGTAYIKTPQEVIDYLNTL